MYNHTHNLYYLNRLTTPDDQLTKLNRQIFKWISCRRRFCSWFHAVMRATIFLDNRISVGKSLSYKIQLLILMKTKMLFIPQCLHLLTNKEVRLLFYRAIKGTIKNGSSILITYYFLVELTTFSNQPLYKPSITYGNQNSCGSLT